MNIIQILTGVSPKVYIAAAFLACLPIAYCAGDSNGAARVQDKWDAAIAEAVIKAGAAANEAMAAKSEDEAIISEMEEAYANAIEEAPESEEPSAASVNLGCERLRRAGAANIPALCDDR